MSSHRSLILLVSLAFLRLAGATLHFSNLDVSFPPLPALTLAPQQPGFGFDLYSALPPAASILTGLPVLPGSCAPYMGAGKECTANMTATNVNFEDCGDPFTVCRCSDATMDMDTVLDRLGRVPVGLRRYMGVVVVLGGTEPHAYTLTNGDIHLFGDCAMDTWVHEASHSFDFGTADPHSGTPDWAQAIADDSCVPDNYSLTNRIEDLAQMVVVKTYALLYDGHLPPGFRADCMAHQLDFMGALPLFNASAFFGNTCYIPDGLPGTRHDVPPPVLNPARAFSTMSVDFAAVPTAAIPTSTALRDHSFAPNGALGQKPVVSCLLITVLLAVSGGYINVLL
ncbi:hypothetical protein DFH09DRAFT_1390735 [Mycena vulgaris]|nr:hypothetical protein DFH09DRAFT_1390735 [Mycena vulgaris]